MRIDTLLFFLASFFLLIACGNPETEPAAPLPKALDVVTKPVSIK